MEYITVKREELEAVAENILEGGVVEAYGDIRAILAAASEVATCARCGTVLDSKALFEMPACWDCEQEIAKEIKADAQPTGPERHTTLPPSAYCPTLGDLRQAGAEGRIEWNTTPTDELTGNAYVDQEIGWLGKDMEEAKADVLRITARLDALDDHVVFHCDVRDAITTHVNLMHESPVVEPGPSCETCIHRLVCLYSCGTESCQYLKGG
jgi:hypothetical protein